MGTPSCDFLALFLPDMKFEPNPQPSRTDFSRNTSDKSFFSHIYGVHGRQWFEITCKAQCGSGTDEILVRLAKENKWSQTSGSVCDTLLQTKGSKCSMSKYLFSQKDSAEGENFQRRPSV